MESTRDAAGVCGRGEEGMALVVALAALVALSAIATAGLWASSSSFRSSLAFSDGGRASFAAEAGLQEFVGPHGLASSSSATSDFGNGERASVTAVAVQPDVDLTGGFQWDGVLYARGAASHLEIVEGSWYEADGAAR